LLTTPPIIAFAGWLARLLRGQRYGVWSMDLHPEAEIEAGMVRPRGFLTRILRWTSDASYRRADFVVDLGAYMKARIEQKGVAERRTRTIHVWSSKEDIEPLAHDRNPLRSELRLTDKFVVMYSGNAGLVHDFDDVLEAARRLDGDARIEFLFVGDGPRRREIEAFAREHGLRNLTYRPYFPREQIRYSLPLADVHLITLRAPFVGVAVPGKLYGIMAAARPALFVGPARCESADTVRDAGCGAVVDPAAPDAAGEIVRTLRAWSTDPALVRAMGDRGRALFLAEYEREPNCIRWADTLAAAWPALRPPAQSPAIEAVIGS
jgi:glycosyltransferase involved in cell wall biosynthesis